MQLHIRGLNTHVLDFQAQETIVEIKARVAEIENVEAAQLVLSCEGAILGDDSLVGSLSSAELDLTIPLLGGKVHGSLARAGKVKGQTPKVEKKEKKKKKTGRAKRRIQYNRNFANVVQAFGRRRGPNANST
ncbi:FAU ubiquitin-like and ribosomal protein S30 isoform X2 [Toxorhynchites rutilus septentrionalis]|nr:FAU ubiquitin-like and ribosomal protein S30 isoform X2 [Toxorhynchites rutilus septentrionalis]